jgi:hypothetical protein
MKIRLGILSALAVLAGCAPFARHALVDDHLPDLRRLGELEVSASVERNSGEILGAVDLMNTGKDTIAFEYAGYCAIAILMYRGSAERGEPRWDSTEWWSRTGECPERTLKLSIPPETLARVVAPVVDTRRILGDSLPGGSYFGAMRINIVQPFDTTLVLPAGPVELQRPSSPALYVMLASDEGAGVEELSPPVLVPPRPSRGEW